MLKIFPVLIVFFTLPYTASAQIDDYSLLFHATGPNANSYYGHDMSWCRDVNNDGCDEILVAVRVPEEEVWLYYGGSPMDTIPDMYFYDEAGGDGYIQGLAYGDRITSQDYGSFVVGYSILYDTSKAFLYNCGPDMDNIYDLILLGEDEGSLPSYGINICIGNFNGDNYNDVIVAASGYMPPGDYGKIYVFYGGPDMDGIADFSMASEYNGWGALFGQSIDCGDVNNDGYDDILATSGYSSDEKYVYLFHGGAEPDTIPDWTYTTLNLSSLCSIIPGLNGDQYGDIISGVAWTDIRIFYGGETLSSEPDQIIDVGSGVPSYAGDLNNDGYHDMIGVYNSIDRLMIYHGGPDSVALDSWIDTPSPNVYAFAGDIDGSGALDHACYSDEPAHYGQVFIYGDSTITSVSPQYQQIITSFELLPAYPNPFNAQTTIPFTLDRAGKVRIDVYDVLGREMRVQQAAPLQAWYPAGMHEVVWNAEGVSSGVYVVRLSVDPPYGGQQSAGTLLHSTRKVVLVK